MSDERPLTIVVAGTYQQFRQWCQEHKRHPTDRRTVPIIEWRDADKIRGLEGPKRGGKVELVRTGAWEDIHGLDHIREIALTQGFEW